jgi:hypothetical protein
LLLRGPLEIVDFCNRLKKDPRHPCAQTQVQQRQQAVFSMLKILVPAPRKRK